MGLAKNGSNASASQGIGVGQEFYAEMLAVANQLITQYGMVASLRNNKTGALRECFIAVTNYAPRDAATQLANPTRRTVLFAAGIGDIPNAPPDWNNEMLVTYKQPPSTPPVENETLAFTEPLMLYSPGGIVVLYQTEVKL